MSFDGGCQHNSRPYICPFGPLQLLSFKRVLSNFLKWAVRQKITVLRRINEGRIDYGDEFWAKLAGALSRHYHLKNIHSQCDVFHTQVLTLCVEGWECSANKFQMNRFQCYAVQQLVAWVEEIFASKRNEYKTLLGKLPACSARSKQSWNIIQSIFSLCPIDLQPQLFVSVGRRSVSFTHLMICGPRYIACSAAK